LIFTKFYNTTDEQLEASDGVSALKEEGGKFEATKMRVFKKKQINESRTIENGSFKFFVLLAGSCSWEQKLSSQNCFHGIFSEFIRAI